MTLFEHKLYPGNYTFKYPKAGEENSVVQIWVYDVSTGRKVLMDTGKETDQYIPRIKWTQDPGILAMVRLNRLQNHIEILLADAGDGHSQVIYSEKNKYYIPEIDDNYPVFLKSGKEFVIYSDKDGYRHFYLYDLNGNLINQITKGPWDVDAFLGIDNKKRLLYYTSSEESPLRRSLYVISLDGKKKIKLSQETGTNRASFSKGFKYYINYYSSVSTPTVVTLHDTKGKLIRTLEDNKELQEKVKEYGVKPKEFFNFKTSDGIELNGWMIKPPDFDPSKKYPVFFTIYGGPGSQTVQDSWSYGWNELLAQRGYIVVSVDNRGTGARGADFKKITYGQLGKYETADQIEAAKYLGSLSYVDASRIGIFGWSYGGFMAASCLFKGHDVFKMGISVAPVTSWRYYDSIYTERYMGLPKDNAKGYDDNSPLNFCDLLEGKYLLIHGTGDDNVHFQNSVELMEALIQAGKQFEVQIYPDRNHGIYGGNTRFHLYTRMTNFILENL
jgi:dipeptidyl-peptidase-4